MYLQYVCNDLQCISSTTTQKRYKMTSSLIDLTKSAKISLEKKSKTPISAQVKIIIDASGSMSSMYNNGTVQNVVTRCLALALNIDKDKSMEVIAFDNSILDLGEATASNYENFINPKKIMNTLGGGTSYSPPLRNLVEKKVLKEATPVGFFKGLFGKKPAPVVESVPAQTNPIFVMMITDGEASDNQSTRDAIKDLGKNAYVQFVGIGTEQFKFLQDLADDFDNCGFSKIENIQNISDDALYDTLVNSEFVSWYNKFLSK